MSRKIFAFVLILALVMSFSVAAFADGEATPALPNAEVKNLGAITVKNNEGDYKFDGTYYTYDLVDTRQLTSCSDPFDLSIAMEFIAKDTAEAAAQNFYGNYTTDFFLTMSGMSGASFVADGCYLAGYYPSFGAWVKIPLDGFTVENGKVYPVITSANFDFKYTDICGSVQDFICGIYLTPAVLEANPNLKVELALGLSEDFDAAQEADFVKVDSYTYDIFALAGDDYVAYVDGATADKFYDSFDAAYTAAQPGDTITLLKDVTLSGKLTVAKNITIDGNGHSIIANHTAFILETSSDCTFKDITLDTNNKAKGVKIASGNVVFDNVTIPNSNKSDAITVYGNLEIKTYFKVASSYTLIDARSGVVTAEPGTVFDITSWRANVSPAKSDLKGAVKPNGDPFFVAYGSTTYYTTLASVTSTIENLTLLDDVALNSNITVKGILNLNGHDLSIADGKTLKTGGNLTITGDGEITGEIVLTDENHTLTATEGLNVTTSVADSYVYYFDGVYTVAKNGNVAAIAANTYATLEAAIDAAQAGDTIVLLKDVKATLPNNGGYAYPAAYSIGKSITIDGDGYEISIDTDNWSKFNDAATGYIFTVGVEDAYIVPGTANDVEVTIKNLRMVGNAAYVRAAINSYAPRTLADGTTANTKLSLDNVSIEGFGTYSLGVNNSDVTVANSSIANGGWGYAVDVSKATAALTVESGEIGIINFVDHESNVKQTGIIKGGNIENVLVDGDAADVKISGGTFAHDVSAYLAEGYGLDSYVDNAGNTVYSVVPVYAITFDVTPADASIVVKDAEGNVVKAEDDGSYLLVDGEYTYSVTKNGYYSKNGPILVDGAAQTVPVKLSPIVIIIPPKPEEPEEPEVPDEPEQPEEPEVPEVCPGDDSCPAHPYDDVITDKWYHAAVDYVVEAGLFKGVAEDEFAPGGEMTRAMFWTVLARMQGVELDESGDVWYEAAMDWAVENGISDGTEAKGDITRQQIITMLWRTVGSPKSEASLDDFADADSIAAWALEAMKWAVEIGIIEGYEDGTLRAANTATRAEVAQLVMNYLEK